MSGIQFFEGIYGGGKRTELGVGTHHSVRAGSIYVPKGYKFSHYNSIEEKEGEVAFGWYEGKYEDTGVYHIPRTLNRVVIEQTDLRRKHMAIAKWWVDVGTGGKNFPVEIPLTTEHALLNFWTGSGTGGISLLDDNIEKLFVPEGLSVKCFVDHFDISNPTVIKTKPGLLISGPKEVDFSKDPFRKYYKSISIMSIGGVEYKLLSVVIDSENAEWETYKTYGNKVCIENDTPMAEATVTQGIGYEKTNSHSEFFEAGISITQTNKVIVGNDMSFVKAEVGLDIALNASGGFDTAEEETESAVLEASAQPGAYAACDAQAVLEMKKGEAPITRRYINMATGAEVEEKSTLKFDAFADATANFSNYVELQTPEAIEWRKQKAAENENVAFANWQAKRKALQQAKENPQ